MYAFTICILIAGCTTKTGSELVKTDTGKIEFPFKPEYSIKWQPGDDKNTLIVLNCLKAYLAGDIKTCAVAFSDSTNFITDNFYFKDTRDSLTFILGQMRGDFAKIWKTFDSWATIYYPEKKTPGLLCGIPKNGLIKKEDKILSITLMIFWLRMEK